MTNVLIRTLLTVSACGIAAMPLQAATLIQPDVKLGVSYLENAGFTGDQDFNTTGAELQAKVKFGFVTERDSVMLVPMIRMTEYSEESVSEREEQRLTLDWFRNFQTAASNSRLDFSRQDLFSTEFDDPLLDPEEVPELDDPESGFVDVETTRNRLHFRQDFAKAIGQRNNFAVALDFVDNSYEDSGLTPRVDYNEVQLDAGWLRALSERTNVVLSVGAERYDGDNDLTANSLSGELGFDVAVSETASLSVMAGYERNDREDAIQDLGSTNVFIFNIGGEKSTELTQFRANLSRNVRPTSVGGLTTATGVTFSVDRLLTERVSIRGGVSAFRQERERGQDTGVNDDRDYLAGMLQLSWQLAREWYLEASVRHTRQEFDAPVLLDGATSEDRSKAFLNLRYRGDTEVRTPRDRRFLRKGY